ncbi:nitric-oxide synthase [Halovenus aranensis]|jgi:nitric-oxide synthase|uniref:Nitric oxide synthase oxygenase n=1 Tax=Halovenus aranensis TaxID=890420 RepID=A0A1G8Z7M3_9EURY|nr:nitric oxide synthase oxygenase [Halovenus aranensis]SDK10415.1 nitric-oxide synthase [Halovenus aranensis]
MHSPASTYGPRDRYEAAENFLRQCYKELGREGDVESRLKEVWTSIGRQNHYVHTTAELEHGAKMAWRNSNRCIGRYFWDSLHVLDRRGIDTAQGVYNALIEHIDFATNDGNIRPTISVFPPAVRGNQQVRIWNHQLLRYAGYETENGVIGDPNSVALTDYCRSRGWSSQRTDFDILPLVIQVGDKTPELFEIPDDVVMEVPLSHPNYQWFSDLGLQWYAVPIISDMRLEIGGLQYPAAPFNGWYMGTEIGSRNFGDVDRYDMLPTVADQLGLDTSTDRTLWKDEALAVLNQAVLHSFEKQGVRIVDHHNAAEQFKRFEQEEREAGRKVTGERSWLLPPNASSTVHIFENTYENEIRTPNFFYREDPPPLQ